MSERKSQARLRLRTPPAERAAMVFIGGKSFRCHCGANVFTQRHDNHFTCNGCGDCYEGFKETP